MAAKKPKTQTYSYVPDMWLKSYPHGVVANLTEANADDLASFLENAAEQHQYEQAITLCLPNGVTGGLSYGQLNQYADRFAAYLAHSLGLQKGDRVAVMLPNTLAYPVVMLGVLKAGCVLVNVNPLYTEGELRHQLVDSGARLLVVFDQFLQTAKHGTGGTDVTAVVSVGAGDFLPLRDRLVVNTVARLTGPSKVKGLNAWSLMDALQRGAKTMRKKPFRAELNTSDLACLQYTGGTTGVSKGAELTHGNLLTNIRQALAMLDAQPDTELRCFLHALPLYHSFSFITLLSGLQLGANNVLVPSPRPVTNLRSAFEQFEFDAMAGVNTLFVKLLDEDWFITNPPNNMQIALAGGAALHDTVARTWIKVVGVEPLQGYGLTEASPVVAVNPPGFTIKRGSVGVPVPDTEIDIVDEKGRSVPPGEQGELLVHGPQVMRGYWQQPDATKQVLADGWLRTGDVAKMDQDGYLYIVDRIKDVVIVSGFNVFPNEIEAEISKHPDVLDVGVIGVPDAQTGEAVWAFVVPRTSDLEADSVLAWCRQLLTSYKVPSRIELVQELPTSAVGKVLRRELRQWVLQGRYG